MAAYGRPPSRNRPGSTTSFASNSTSVAIDRLMDLTTCGHCKRQLKDARLLPCHHSFCSNCILEMISCSNSKDEFLCPTDRQVIKIPQFGITVFESDKRIQELEDVISDLEESIYEDQNVSVADLDINVESLSKGVKDIEHASAMSQHAVNTTFEGIYTKLKQRQDELISEIKRKSKKQILNLEYEKYRLIETKKFQNNSFFDTSFYEEDFLTEPLNVNKSTTTSTPPSPNSSFSRQQYDTPRTSESRMALINCHIGQQHLEFLQNQTIIDKLSTDLKDIGLVTCDFDLKVKLERNLLALDEYPFGMKIGGGDETEGFDWLASKPRGVTKGLNSRIIIANSGRNEIVILDNSFNVKNIIPGKGKFLSCSDVTSCGNNIFVADEDGCQVVMLSLDGSVIKRFGRPGNGALELKRPNGITSDSRGRIIVSDSLNHRVKVLSPDLQKCVLTLQSDKKKYKEAARFSFPCGVATDKDDNIYVTDTNNKRVVMLSKEGRFMREIHPADYHDPRSVAVSSDCKLLLTDREHGKMFVCDGNGTSMSCISGIMDNSGTISKFGQPYGVIVDGTDKILITDAESNAVYVF